LEREQNHNRAEAQEVIAEDRAREPALVESYSERIKGVSREAGEQLDLAGRLIADWPARRARGRRRATAGHISG
jgi:hypothetical protein